MESALGVSPNQIVLYGLSLGAAVALELACTEEVAGLILESPFTCTHAMGAMIVPILPLFKFLPNRFNSLEKINTLNVPLLVIHGDIDTTTPSGTFKGAIRRGT